jgi:hypothetical protein
MNKKIIFIIISILILIGAGLLIWFLFKQPQTNNQKVANQTSLINQKIKFINLSNNEQEILYFNPDSIQYFSFSLKDKKEQPLSDSLILPQEALISPDKKGVIFKTINEQYAVTENPYYISSRKEGDIVWHYYNFSAKKPVVLPENIKEVEWLVDNQKIIYQYFDNNFNNLNIASADGSNRQKIIDLTFTNINLVAINENTVGYYPNPTDKIYLVDINKKRQSTVNLGGQFEAENIIFTNGQIGIVKDKKITLLNLSGQTIKTITLTSSLPTTATNFMLSSDFKTLYFTADDFLYKLDLPN